jgi:hypothetical protein
MKKRETRKNEMEVLFVRNPKERNKKKNKK